LRVESEKKRKVYIGLHLLYIEVGLLRL